MLHVYVHCVLYENENTDASSKVSSFINVTYDREFRTTPVLVRSNFVDVMEARVLPQSASCVVAFSMLLQGFSFDLRYGLSDMLVIEMREASANALENAMQDNTRMIGIVFATLPESVNHNPQKLWYKFKGVPPKVREVNGKIVPTLGGQVLLTTMITTSEVRQRLEHALDSVNAIEKEDKTRSLIDSLRFSVTNKLKSVFSRAPLKEKVKQQLEAKKIRDEQIRASFLAKNVKKMNALRSILAAQSKSAVAQPLVHLDLSASCVYDKDVVPVILQATNLTVLRLSHCPNITSALFAETISDIATLRDALSAPLRKLHTVSLRNTPACDDSAIIRLCGAATSLHSLDIGQSQRRITSASVSMMADQLGSKLQRLMMDSCPGESITLHLARNISCTDTHSPAAADVTEDVQNMITAAVGATCSVLNLSYQAVSSFTISFLVSQHLLELSLNGVACVMSSDVQRICTQCPLLQVSGTQRMCVDPLIVFYATTCNTVCVCMYCRLSTAPASETTRSHATRPYSCRT